MANVAVSVATATTTQLVAAPTSPKFIRVLGYLLVAGGTQTAKLQDGASDLMGALPLSSTCGEVECFDEDGVFDLTPGNALNLVTTAAVQLSGHVKYAIKGG